MTTPSLPSEDGMGKEKTQDVLQESQMGTECVVDPVTKGYNSAPTTIVDIPGDTSKLQETGEHAGDLIGADEPRISDAHSDSLQYRFKNLQARPERREKEMLEQRLAEFAHPHDAANDQDHNISIDEDWSLSGSASETNDQTGTHTSRTIRFPEKELRILHHRERKSPPLWDQRQQVKTKMDRWVDEHNGRFEERREPENELDIPLKAELNLLDWQQFEPRSRPKPWDFVIDILEGEPVTGWAEPRVPRAVGTSRYSTASEKINKLPNPAATSDHYLRSGQDPVPERICINSEPILSTLERVSGVVFSSAPLVMIRPYRALVYYDTSIREELRHLRAKLTQDHPAPSAGEHGKPKTQFTEATQDETSEVGSVRIVINSHTTSESDSTAYQHVQCLVRFMDEYLCPKMTYLASDHCQKVFFSDIWYLFKPGDEVIEQSLRQVYRIHSIFSTPDRGLLPYHTAWEKNGIKHESTEVNLFCVYIDFDGKNLGPTVRQFRIPHFDGEKAVTSLEVYPLRFAEARQADAREAEVDKPKESRQLTLRESLIARARMFMDMTSFKHMHYSGLTLDTQDEVDSGVVVDFEEALSYVPQKRPRSRKHDSETAQEDWRPRLRNLVIEPLLRDINQGIRGAPSYKHDNIFDEQIIDDIRNSAYMQQLIPKIPHKKPPLTIVPRPLPDIKEHEDSLTPEELLITPYRVFGFILRNRKWAQFDLKYLSLPENSIEDENLEEEEDNKNHAESQDSTEMGGGAEGLSGSQIHYTTSESEEKNQTTFGQLVLPEGHKDMITSLISQHFRNKEAASKDPKGAHQVDIVRGKGKGLIILLHGAPGVGKTTTAEGVAEMFKKPLFQITCGDLGTSALEVEEALETHFALANRWDCILLLDEADVFLAARSKEDFRRNGMVSVFLRILEYYAGILFLTTNRVGDFDEAFASRIHIILYYPQLTLDNTLAIFELNLGTIEKRFKRRGRTINIEKKNILAFARDYFDNHPEEKWNGRQIRNACQTALALAEYRAQGSSHKGKADLNAVVDLRVKDMEVVSNAYLQFMHYLNKIRGKDAEMWAKSMKLRAREMDILLHGATRNADQGYFGEEKEPGKKNDLQHGAVPPTAAPFNSVPSAATLPVQQATTTPQPPHGIFPGPPPAPSAPPPGVPPESMPGQQYQANFPPTQGFPSWPYPQGYGLTPATTYAAPTIAQGVPLAGPPQWSWLQAQQQQQQTTQPGHPPSQAPTYGIAPSPSTAPGS